MNRERPRHQRLKPLSIDERISLSLLAMRFFQPLSYETVCEVLSKTPTPGHIKPFEGFDFIRYLEKSGELPEADRYIYLIQNLLSQLERAHLLHAVGPGRSPISAPFYYSMKEFTELEKEGFLWLAPALGPELLLNAYSESTLQITGITNSDDAHAGTALAVAPNWLLTCAHVVNDMKLDKKQSMRGSEFEIVSQRSHSALDVALIEVDKDLPCLPGLAFREPLVTEEVYTIGYPRVPLSRHPAIIMQRGEVTNPHIKTFSGEDVFLYSAIARPGNSGGPVIAATGHVVGIVTESLEEEVAHRSTPFYAGISTSELAHALEDLGADVQLPIERYE